MIYKLDKTIDITPSKTSIDNYFLLNEYVNPGLSPIEKLEGNFPYSSCGISLDSEQEKLFAAEVYEIAKESRFFWPHEMESIDLMRIEHAEIDVVNSIELMGYADVAAIVKYAKAALKWIPSDGTIIIENGKITGFNNDIMVAIEFEPNKELSHLGKVFLPKVFFAEMAKNNNSGDSKLLSVDGNLTLVSKNKLYVYSDSHHVFSGWNNNVSYIKSNSFHSEYVSLASDEDGIISGFIYDFKTEEHAKHYAILKNKLYGKMIGADGVGYFESISPVDFENKICYQLYKDFHCGEVLVGIKVIS